MFDQHQNFENAILKKKARIEEINLILAQPRPSGHPTGSMRRLIEERLHLEQAVAELEQEDRRFQSQIAARIPFRWEQLDQRLISPKTNELAEEMHKMAAEAERRIGFETARSGNSAGYLPRLFDFHEQLTDEWARKLYIAHCEAWTQQNRSVTGEFIRAVWNRVISQMIAARKSSVTFQVTLRSTRIGEPINSAALGEWHRKMERLATRWGGKLEAEAVASEYRAAREHDLKNRDTEADSSKLTGPGRASPPSKSTSKKPGRVPSRVPEFVDVAGNLWLQAKSQNNQAKVSSEQLSQIGSKLDEKGYVPPAKFLERRCADELKTFNSRNSHSKSGSIKTWSQLVTLADKDHLRGMRKLLSRCAKNHLPA